MRNLHRRGLVASLEEEQLVEQLNEIKEEVQEIGENAESLETDLVELTEMVAEQADEDVQTEEAGMVEEKLEDIAEVVERAEDNGGMTPEAAEVVEVAVESLCDVVGMKMPRLPSLEHYGSASGRIKNTQITLEAIKETAVKVWEAIVAAFKRAIEWVKGFFAKVFDVATKTKARAAKLKEVLEKTKDEPTATEVKNDRLFRQLAVGNDVGDVKVNLGKVVKVAEGAFTTRSGVAAHVEALAANATAGSVKDMAKKKEAISGYQSDVLPGNVVVFCDEVTADDNYFNNLSTAQMGVKSVEAKGDAKAIKTLSIAEMKTVVSEVAALMDKIMAYRSEVEKTSATKKKLMATAESFGKSAKDAKGDDKADLEAAKKTFQYLARNMDRVPAAVATYSAKTGKASLDLVELSLKSGKAKEEKKEEKAAA